MRLLNTLLALGFVLAAAAPALADGPGDHATSNQTARDERAATHAEARERHQALVAARHAALDSFHENRTRILQEYNATLHGIRASFLENKTAVLDACRALRNETSGNESAKCVRDGLKPLIAKAKADMAEAREAAKAALLQARSEAVKGFQAQKAKANARSPHAD